VMTASTLPWKAVGSGLGPHGPGRTSYLARTEPHTFRTPCRRIKGKVRRSSQLTSVGALFRSGANRGDRPGDRVGRPFRRSRWARRCSSRPGDRVYVSGRSEPGANLAAPLARPLQGLGPLEVPGLGPLAGVRLTASSNR